MDDPRRRVRLSPKVFTVCALGLSAISVMASLWGTRHGPGVFPDSVTYLTAGRNVADGRGFIDFTGLPLKVFPPGFPLVATTGDVVGIAPLDTVRIFEALIFGVTVMLASLLFRRHLRSAWVLLGATAFVATLPMLLRTSEVVASDSFFCCITVAFLLVLDSLVARRGPATPLLFASGLLGGSSFLIRYAGIAVIAAGIAIVFVASYRRGFGSAIRRTLAFGAVASVMPAAWLIRNANGGTQDLLGPRAHSPMSPLDILRKLLEAFDQVFLPSRVPQSVIVAAVVLAGGLAGLSVYLSRRDRLRKLREILLPIWPLLVFALVFALFLLISEWTTAFDISPRILLPLVVPTVATAAYLIDVLLQSRRPGLRRRLVLVAAGGAFALLVVNFVSFAHWLSADPNAGGYRDDAALTLLLDRLPRRSVVFSNDPWKVEFLTGREPELLAPMPFRPGFSHRPATVHTVEAAARSGRPTYLVWFPTSPASGTAKPAFPFGNVVATQDTHDGRATVYRLSSPTRTPRIDRPDGVELPRSRGHRS